MCILLFRCSLLTWGGTAPPPRWFSVSWMQFRTRRSIWKTGTVRCPVTADLTTSVLMKTNTLLLQILKIEIEIQIICHRCRSTWLHIRGVLDGGLIPIIKPCKKYWCLCGLVLSYTGVIAALCIPQRANMLLFHCYTCTVVVMLRKFHHWIKIRSSDKSWKTTKENITWQIQN